jgi:hypothetical protein
LYGSFHPSYSNSKNFIDFFSLNFKMAFIFSHMVS